MHGCITVNGRMTNYLSAFFLLAMGNCRNMAFNGFVAVIGQVVAHTAERPEGPLMVLIGEGY